MDTSRSRTHPPEPRILYGRIAVYAASLLLAFVVGTLVGRGSPDEAELVVAQQEVAELRRTNYDLEQQVAAYAAGQALPPGQDPVVGGMEAEETAALGDGDEAGALEGAAEATETAGSSAADAAEEAPAVELPPGSSSYEVQSGDTLTSIAEQVYGDGSKYTLIADANGVDAQLEVGQELIIPPAPEDPTPEDPALEDQAPTDGTAAEGAGAG